MAKYSPIAPLPILLQLKERKLLGDYLLLLAHDVCKYPREYEELAFDLGDEATIIMDNGTIENGSPVSLAMLMEAASIVNANVVVGPDVVGDFQETQKLMIEQADFIRQDHELMLIPQGDCLEEICECIRWMDERYQTPTSQWWGIPRWIANEVGSRSGPINYINNYARGNAPPKIHLLGMSHDLRDDIECSKTLSVTGIDSANPLVLGYNNRRLNAYKEAAHIPRGTYWDECIEVNEMMAGNVEWLRDVLGA